MSDLRPVTKSVSRKKPNTVFCDLDFRRDSYDALISDSGSWLRCKLRDRSELHLPNHRIDLFHSSLNLLFNLFQCASISLSVPYTLADPPHCSVQPLLPQDIDGLWGMQWQTPISLPLTFLLLMYSLLFCPTVILSSFSDHQTFSFSDSFVMCLCISRSLMSPAQTWPPVYHWPVCWAVHLLTCEVMEDSYGSLKV